MTVAPVRALPELKTVDDVRARALLRAAIVKRLLGHELYDRPADPIQRADEDQLFHATSGKDDEGHPIKEPLADDSGKRIDADRLRTALDVASDVERRDDDEVLKDADAVLARFAENAILEAKNKGVVRFRYLESPADKLEQIDVLRELSVVDPKVKTGAKKKNRIACRGLEGILAWLDMQEEERNGRPLYETPPDILTRVERHLTQDPLREILEPGIASVRVCVQKYQDLCDQFHPNAINEAHGQPRELVDAIDEFLSVVDAVSAYYNDRIQAGAPEEPAPIDLASIVELPDQDDTSAADESPSAVRGVFENVRDAARAATDQVKSNLKSGKPKAKGVKHSDPWYLRLRSWASKRWSDTGNIYRDLGKAAVVFLAIIGVRSVFTGSPASASGGDSSIPTNTIPPGNGSQVANGKGAPRVLSGGAAMAALAEAERFRTSTDRAFDDLAQLQQELVRWRDEVVPLPTNEEGKRLAREPRNFPAYQDRLKAVRDFPGAREVAGLETRLKRYRKQAQELVDQKIAPPPELTQQVEKDRQQILQAVDGYQQARLAIRSLVALAPSGPIKTGEPTLQKAMEIQAEKAATDYRNTIAEAKKQADELKKAADAKIIADAAEADAAAKITAAKKEAEEKAAKDPALVAKFKFILGDGLCQFGTGGYVGHRKWDQPGPCGFKNLNARTPTSTAGIAREAVLGDFKTFIYVACGRSMDNAYRTYANNDRGGFHTFPPTLENGQPDLRSPEAKRLRVLFEEAKRYAPIWHRLGMLR